MRIGLMFTDITRSLFRRPATERYPYVRPASPARLRSFLKWNQQACTGCGLCSMDCPSSAIHVSIVDRKEKKFVFSYRPDQCLFCGQCVESCRQGSLTMVNDQWELAALDKKPFVITLGDVDGLAQKLAAEAASRPAEPEKS